MNFGTQTTYAERRARVSGNALTITNTSDVTKGYLNDGVREFAKRVNGLLKEQYLTVSPRFDVRTNFAIRLTITGGSNALTATDVAMATSSFTDYGGATVASAMEAALSAAGVSCTVSWSTTKWTFTIDSGDAVNTTHMEVGEPSGITYADARDLLFNKTGTQASTVWEGNVPMDCTVEVAMPSDFLEILYVEWDNSPLSPAPWDLFTSPGSQGTPRYYSVKDNRIRISPSPLSQKMFHVWYKHMPADLDTDGTADATECPLPTEVHMAPVYYAAAMLAMEQDDEPIYQREMAMFTAMVNDFRIRRANQTPTMFPRERAWSAIQVEL